MNPNGTDTLFHFVNRHPEGLREHSSAAAVVNAISIATGEDWWTVFRRLLDAAHRFCLMPEDERCVRELLQTSGFVRQASGHPMGKTPETICNFLQKDSLGGARVVVRFTGWMSGDTAAILPDGEGKYISAGWYRGTKETVRELWLRWPDGEDHSPVARRRGKSTESAQEYRIPKNHGEFEYRQENPGNNFIGDCVVRGIASACGITWHEAVDQLGSHGYAAINNRIAYKRVLADNGFVKQPPLRPGGRYLSGVEFCEEVRRICRRGEVIFAHVGSSHVAAVLPTRQASGNYSYRIVDTWDSTSCSITDWWMQPPENIPKKAEKPKPASAEMHDRVVHPTFGQGTVQNISGSGAQSVLEIRFADGSVKKLASRWVLEHCTVESTQKEKAPV